MNYVDFLGLIQTAVLLNFAAIYWRENKDSDFIAFLFKKSSPFKYFSSKRDICKKDFEEKCKCIDKLFEKNIGDKKLKDLTDKDQTFLSKKNEFSKVGQDIVNKVGSNTSSTQSHYFEHICILIGLYSFTQWFLLPCIDATNESIVLYIYLFLTQIVLVILLYYFIKELIYLFDICTYKGGSESYVQFCVIFVFSFIVSLIAAIYIHRYDINTVPLLCDTNTFIILSILIPFVPIIGYFLINLLVFHVKMYNEANKVEELIQQQNTLFTEINNIY